MLRNSRILLTPLEEEDLATSYLWINSHEMMLLLGAQPRFRTMTEVFHWWSGLSQKKDYQLWAIKTLKGEMIGQVDLDEIDLFHRSAKIGVMIGDSRFRRQGYAREALEAVHRYAFEVLALHRLGAEILGCNEPAQELFRSMGYEQEGSLRQAYLYKGERVDITIWGRLVQDDK